MVIRLSDVQAKRLGITSSAEQQKTLSQLQAKNKALLKQSGRNDVEPQELLTYACKARWPESVDEFKGAVPNRKFRLDIAFPDEKLCIELDGWQFHGRMLADFKKDRERQNLLTINGWHILRFTASDVKKTNLQLRSNSALPSQHSDEKNRQ